MDLPKYTVPKPPEPMRVPIFHPLLCVSVTSKPSGIGSGNLCPLAAAGALRRGFAAQNKKFQIYRKINLATVFIMLYNFIPYIFMS